MKRLNSSQTADMIGATVQKPKERQKSIQEGVENTLKYSENEYMNSFGFKVDRDMLSVQARVLPAPKVVFKNEESLRGDDGQWNLRNVKVCRL
jgi:eukaryotic translation initiation factor 2C